MASTCRVAACAALCVALAATSTDANADEPPAAPVGRVAIGDEMRVRLVRVDSAERKIDFEHVAKTGEHFNPRRRGGKAPARHK